MKTHIYGISSFLIKAFMDTQASVLKYDFVSYLTPMRRALIIMLFVFFVSCVPSTYGQNIAKGKKYTFSEKPNYALTTGTDNIDLTDGRKKSGMRFWQDKSTVGWSYLQEVTIDLDLGSVYTIDGFLINTARGQAAGVNFPLSCIVFTSLDNSQFEYHGDLMLSGDNDSGDYKVQNFHMQGIKSKGRYVKFILPINGKFLFLDEIEVYGNKENNTRRANKKLIKKSDLDAFANEAIKKSVNIRSQKKHIEYAKHYLGKLAPAENINTKKAAYDAVKRIQSQALSNNVIFTPIGSTDALNSFHLECAITNQDNVVNHGSKLQYFSLINNTAQQESIVFRAIENLDYKIFEVLPVISQNKVNIKDALKPVINKSIDIAPGENKYFVVNTIHQQSGSGSIKVFTASKNEIIGKINVDHSNLEQNRNGKLHV